MKTLHKLAASLLLSTITAQLSTVFAQGTAFTYQGRLINGTEPANGSYDLTFTLYDADQPAGNLIAGPLTNSATAASNGLFTSTVDFGAGVFTGTNYWLEIAVSTNGAGSFTTLAPRQQITPTPYAITADSVVSGGLAAGIYGNAVTLNNAGNNFSGTFTGDGTSVANVNAASLNGLTSAGFWNTNGNAGADPATGAFLGTTDNLPLEFKVNGCRALRLEYTYDTNYLGAAPNVIGGNAANIVSNGVVGAFIGGGGFAGVSGSRGEPNRVGGRYASVLGGYGNTASGNKSTAMGILNTASGDGSTAMGAFSTASGVISTAMGNGTTASGDDATAMGIGTIASGNVSTAMGFQAHALHDETFVWSDGANFSSAASHQFLIHADGGVGIGTAGPPPGGLNVASGGLAVSGASSPVYYGAKGVFIESQSTYGAIFAFDYTGANTLPLCLNTPGGNVGIGLTAPAYKLDVNGSINAWGTVYANGVALTSDRNAKENFTAINPREVLAKVANLPLTQWNYKTDSRDVQHLGPMAQDFQAAFGLDGADDKHISIVDEGGVALAAIQGLNQKVEEKEARIEQQNSRIQNQAAEIEALKQNLAELKQLVQSIAEKK